MPNYEIMNGNLASNAAEANYWRPRGRKVGCNGTTVRALWTTVRAAAGTTVRAAAH